MAGLVRSTTKVVVYQEMEGIVMLHTFSHAPISDCRNPTLSGSSRTNGTSQGGGDYLSQKEPRNAPSSSGFGVTVTCSKHDDTANV